MNKYRTARCKCGTEHTRDLILNKGCKPLLQAQQGVERLPSPFFMIVRLLKRGRRRVSTVENKSKGGNVN